MIICDKAKGSFWEMTLKLFFLSDRDRGGSRPLKWIYATYSCSRAKILLRIVCSHSKPILFIVVVLVVVVKPLLMRVAFLAFAQIYQKSSIKRYFLLRTLNVHFERSSTFRKYFDLISWITILRKLKFLHLINLKLWWIFSCNLSWLILKSTTKM